MRVLNLLIHASAKLMAFCLLLPCSVSSAIAAGEWPMQLASGENRITIHQPQPDEWSEDRLKARAVVVVETPSSAKPVYGVINFEVRTTIDTADHEVRFTKLRVTSVDFPWRPELSQLAKEAFQQNGADLLKPMSLGQLRSDLAIRKAEEKRSPPIDSQEPPKILFSSSPALLVLIDGKPVFRETESSGLLRVLNTRALILLDTSSGKYFLRMGDEWLEAPSLTSPWSVAENPPPSLEKARSTAMIRKDAELLEDPRAFQSMDLKEGRAPKVYVSTGPAELLQTKGVPSYRSIAGTGLLYIENTRNTVLLNQADQRYYVLLSGRWYRAKSLTGPWKNVSAKALPADFAKIPENHLKGDLLASVSGTPQAREAVIRNEVPQAAEVNRQTARLELRFDGDPQFKPIPETQLRYAINSTAPVIEVNSHSYYALQEGVWFVASAPKGPWSLATWIPPVIYTIPPSSPMHHVTYARIYGMDFDSVYVGYTPGYLGSYCCSDGTVVFGTGYSYSPWVGSFWIGAPWTFGFGWSWSNSGWGYGWGWNWGYYPWWGPYWGVGSVVYPAPPPTEPTAPGTVAPNVYDGWSKSAVTSKTPDSYTTPYQAGSSEWQPYQRGVTPEENSAWNPPAPSSNAGVGGSWGSAPPTSPSDPTRTDALNNPPTNYSGGGGWGPAMPAPPSGAAPPPAAPAPAAPAPPAPAAPPPGVSHSGAAGGAFPGGSGWGSSR